MTSLASTTTTITSLASLSAAAIQNNEKLLTILSLPLFVLDNNNNNGNKEAKKWNTVGFLSSDSIVALSDRSPTGENGACLISFNIKDKSTNVLYLEGSKYGLSFKYIKEHKFMQELKQDTCIKTRYFKADDWSNIQYELDVACSYYDSYKNLFIPDSYEREVATAGQFVIKATGSQFLITTSSPSFHLSSSSLSLLSNSMNISNLDSERCKRDSSSAAQPEDCHLIKKGDDSITTEVCLPFEVSQEFGIVRQCKPIYTYSIALVPLSSILRQIDTYKHLLNDKSLYEILTFLVFFRCEERVINALGKTSISSVNKTKVGYIINNSLQFNNSPLYPSSSHSSHISKSLIEEYWQRKPTKKYMWADLSLGVIFNTSSFATRSLSLLDVAVGDPKINKIIWTNVLLPPLSPDFINSKIVGTF